MPRQIIDDFIPFEVGDAVLTEIPKLSAIERFGRPEVMRTDTKRVPRFGRVNVEVVEKGAVYGESNPLASTVPLDAAKFGNSFVLADEDLQDSTVDVLAGNRAAWANGYARNFDLACLGTTAAADGADTQVPFNSVYHTLSVADATLGYTAGANIVKTAGATGNALFQLFNETLGAVENGDYAGNLVVLAHTSFAATFRGMRGAEAIDSPVAPTLFGLPVQFTSGAKTTTGGINAPANGNPILVVANRDLLIKGVRSGPEARVIPAAYSRSDEAVQIVRARRAFALGHPGGAAVLEMTATA